MKRIGLGSKLLFIVFVFSSFISANLELIPLKIGQKMPRQFTRMRAVNESHYIIKDLYKENGLCVIFSNNTCPFVVSWESRYNEIFELCVKNKIGFVVLNSNEDKRKGNDSFLEMQKRAKEKKYKFLYAEDKNSKMADALGALYTPEAFLFDKFQALEYKGAIDDNMKDEKLVKVAYLKNAIESLGKNRKPSIKETKIVGCDIKRLKEF